MRSRIDALQLLTWGSALLFAGVALIGCGTANYYRAAATTAATVGAGYRALDRVDEEKTSAVKAEAPKDKAKAQADLDAWAATFKKARIALDAAEDMVEKCMPSPNLGGCLDGLVAAGADVAKALTDAGVKR